MRDANLVSKLYTLPQKSFNARYNFKTTFAFSFNMLRHIFAYHLAILVLLTNVGIPVFTHVCHGQGTAKSSLLVPSSGCCKRNQAVQKEQACQPTEQCEKTSTQPKPCCENRFFFAQKSFDLFDGLQTWVIKALADIFIGPPAPIAAISIATFIQHFFSFQPHAPPVPLHGRSLLVFKQVFRC